MPIYRIAGKTILFIHVPKAAGTSIEAWLDTYGTESFRAKQRWPGFPCVPQHWHGDILSELFQPGMFDYSFCLVRDPFRRLISEYNYRITRPRLRNRVLPKPGFQRWMRRSFAAYARDPYVHSNHMRPQSAFPIDGTEVFRIEDQLAALRDRLQDICGIEMSSDFPRQNVSRKIPDQTYDADMAARAADFYAADFDRFGYDRDGWKDLAKPTLHATG